MEAGIIASSVGLLGAMLLSFQGPLFTAAPRPSERLAVRLLPIFRAAGLVLGRPGWGWTAHRGGRGRRSKRFGGLVLFAVQLARYTASRLQHLHFQLDASMTERQWNQLAVGALVFDPLVYRAPTVFGRPTRSSPSWYARSDAWERLRDAANPQALAGAGFTYMYLDGQYWENLGEVSRRRLRTAACVRSTASMVSGAQPTTQRISACFWISGPAAECVRGPGARPLDEPGLDR